MGTPIYCSNYTYWVAARRLNLNVLVVVNDANDTEMLGQQFTQKVARRGLPAARQSDLHVCPLLNQSGQSRILRKRLVRPNCPARPNIFYDSATVLEAV